MAVVEPFVVEAKPRRGWFARNWWWVLLVVLLGGFLACAGLCAGICAVGLGVVKESPPYQMALTAVRGDPQVVERLGEPIKDGWVPSGQMNTENDRGDALFHFRVTGPKGSADVSSQSRMIGGVWDLVRVEVTFEDGQRITLETAKSEEGGPGDAPPWRPR